MTESAAVLMKDGAVIAAAEQERFSRKKHDGGIPYLAIEHVLEAGGITLGDVDVVAMYWDPYQLSFRLKWMAGMMIKSPSQFIRKLKRAATVWSGSHTGAEDAGWMDMFKIKSKLAKRFGVTPKKVEFIDHHNCHMATCYFGSDFDECAILIMDGAGEAACTTAAIGRGDKFELVHQHMLPHSLGHFYSSITGYLGFKMLDGEYKLMGLSPYGDPSGAKWMRENYLITTAPGRYSLNSKALDYHQGFNGIFTGTLADHFGEPREPSEMAEFNDRHRDIAASAQRCFEEVVLDLAEDLKRKSGLSKLAIAGGCGLNCVANGQVLRHGVFDEIYVPPVPHDSGGALGAAMCAYQNATGKRPDPVKHAQYGPSFSNDDIEVALKAKTGLKSRKMNEDELCSTAAKLLTNNGVIAWFQGPMEYGPRALGNRSFLADPRSDSIRDTINAKIKKRELFRPFAPSVKAERAAEYFEIEQPSPFMTIIVPVRPEARGKIPAVTHVDGTARPQTVEKDVNLRYWKLIDQFEQLTGVGALLNTSFNIQEPIVCTPAEALNTFSNSTTDAIALGDYWVTREDTEE